MQIGKIFVFLKHNLKFCDHTIKSVLPICHLNNFHLNLVLLIVCISININYNIENEQ